MNLLLKIVQALTVAYDIVTWPVYYLLFTVDIVASESKQRAKSIDADNPEAPWRTTESLHCLATSPRPGVNNLGDLMQSAIDRFPDRNCLGTRELLAEEDEKQPNGRIFKKLSLGNYRWETFGRVNERIEEFGLGLMQLGLRQGQRLLIFAETRAEWQISVHAAFRYNFPIVTLYSTLGDDALVFGINQAEVEFVVTSDDLVGKFKSLLPQLTKLRHVIYMNNGVMGGKVLESVAKQIGQVNYWAMTQVEELGRESANAKMQQRQQLKPADANDLAVIMYTSGSTGQPKGVQITHGNLLATIVGAVPRIPGLGERESDLYIGYLPLAHVLELVAELACLQAGVPIGYSSPLTLSDLSNKIKRGTKGDVTMLRPTLMASVPAIMDRIYKNVWEKVNEGGAAKRALFQWAYDYKKSRMMRGLPSPMLDKIVFKQIRSLLGGRIRLMLSGGAPLSVETQRFMNVCFGIPIVQGYGLTETTGVTTLQSADDLSAGKVGTPIACCQIRLRDWPEGGYTCRDKPRPRGEVVVGGHNITMGYFRMPEKTAEDFYVDDEGIRWFCTGDIGSFAENGTLEIIDRRKDLVKLQGGEYISLGKVETVLGVSAYVEQLCVYGDSYKDYAVVLVVPKRTQIVQLAERLGLESADYESLLNNAQIKKEVLKDMQSKAVNKVARFEIPAKIFLSSEPWTPETGLVTDALKLKRKQLQQHFQKAIDLMYNGR